MKIWVNNSYSYQQAIDEFVVGDGQTYGIFQNCPLKTSETYMMAVVAEINLEGEPSEVIFYRSEHNRLWGWDLFYKQNQEFLYYSNKAKGSKGVLILVFGALKTDSNFFYINVSNLEISYLGLDFFVVSS